MKKIVAAERDRSKGRKLKLTKADRVYIGLDVHKRTIHVAVRINGMLYETAIVQTYKQLLQLLALYRVAVIKVVYEAGPTGYGLYRLLVAEGYPAEVVDPGETPESRKRRSKTDRIDCRKLAEHAEKGTLKAVFVPSEEEEADRQVSRLREQVKQKRKRVMAQIKSLLLQHGLKEPAGLAKWSAEGVEELKRLEVCWQLRFSLDTYIEEYEHLGEQMRKVEAKQKELSGEKRHAPAVTILRSHPAVGPVTAITFRTEVFSPERFKTGHQVSKYLGLDPVVRESGEHSTTVGISRAGRPYVRGLLVQAAWRWIKADPRAAEFFRRVTSNTGNSKKAVVALARKLAVVLWTMLRNGELYRAA